MKVQLDPLKFAKHFWPHVTFYGKQVEVIYSVVENDETYCPAANMTGKDFVTGFILLYFFLTRHPCRIVTTSADYSQLESVLWGEVRRFIQESSLPLDREKTGILDSEKGGPLLVNHLHLRKLRKNGEICGLSYCLGRVAAKGEGMLGHHIADTGDGIPRTLWVCDEASGVDDINYDRATTWARRVLVIGNPWPCPGSFWERNCEGGDIPAPDIR